MTLKRDLDRPESPIRVFFDEHLPCTKGPCATIRAAMAGSAATRPAAADGGDPLPEPIPWDVLGHAISARVLWGLEGPHEGAMGGRMPSIAGRSVSELSLLLVAPEAIDEFGRLVAAGPGPAGPDRAARISWVAGLLDRAYRSGRIYDVWLEALEGAADCDALLTCAPNWAVADIVTMHDLCGDAITRFAGGPVVVGPTFAGSLAVGGADADFIADRTLIDVKATIKPTLRTRDLRQIVSYALLDWDDAYGIDTVGLLAARQGVVISWPLEELLTEMAGQPTTAAVLREGLQKALAP